ncbi:hypothetical protein HYX14_00470 [Candidatus Woesearchaeota archaeon]|nr:hypothetical protein [Candidatus Woesearchaeota archaeon]
MTTFQILTVGKNFADAELMAGVLQQAKFSPVESVEKADILIFNISRLTETVEKAFFAKVEEITVAHPYKPIILTGCVPRDKKLRKYSQLGPWKIHHIAEAMEETLHENVLRMLETDEIPPLNAPRLRRCSFQAYVPITRGCLEGCLSCKKSPFISYSPEDIKQEVEKCAGAGEIQLLSYDAARYEEGLPVLLKELSSIPGSFRLRLGLMNPETLLGIKDQLAPLFQQDKIYKYLHLALAAGNNQQLKKLKQKYTSENILSILSEVRKHAPELHFMADVFVPDEDEDAFWQTQTFIRSLNADVLNFTKDSGIDEELFARRWKVLSDIAESIGRMQNERWLGWTGSILIMEQISDVLWRGRNYAYKPILLEGKFELGQKVTVKITKVFSTELRGEKS